MTTQTSYPVFENGQVLTSGQLNDAVEYLEQQDRLTRNKLIGIGIVCGLDVSYEQAENRIRITRGCALTSAGYLITLEESLLNQFRPYTLPVPSVEEAPDDVIEEARYPFFFDSGGNQIPLWELLPNDHTTSPSEPNPTPISAAFLADKVVMLFLECNLESLRNCDVNDCSDKGSEMKFTLRKLLVTRADAQTMLDTEHEIAGRPVDRHNHPRHELKKLSVEKINPSAHAIDNYSELLFRILGIVATTGPQLTTQLKESYSAFEYMLSDMYPATSFPNGPFGDPEYFANVVGDLTKNIFLGEHLYGYVYDVVQSYNEFLNAACWIEAECCPNPERFPKHVLLGIPDAQPAAFAIDFAAPGDALSFDPLTANTGIGPATKPEQFRHYFIPSALYDWGGERIDEVRSLHYRTYLLAYRYDTDGLVLKDIRITPSKDGDVELSDKAIPFYYKFNAADDLHRNWSFQKTTRNRLSGVYSYQFIDPTDHPLKYKADAQNFYRVEGIIGKPLGKVMSELIAQKRELGLQFGIEPVLMGVSMQGDAASASLTAQARSRAQEALRKLLLCRMRDLDVVFLVLMAALFYYLFLIIRLISGVNTRTIAGLAAPSSGGDAGEPAGVGGRLFRLNLGFVRERTEFKIDRKTTELELNQIRGTTYLKGSITSKLTEVSDPQASIGGLYAEVKDAPSSANLFDRTRNFARTLDPNADADVVAGKIYPAVSLLDKTEELVEVVSASSIADFDFQAFDVKYRGFTQAFDNYLETAQFEGAGAQASITNTNLALADNYGAVAATGPQTLVSNLATELQERIQRIFSELLLGGYAKRNPGMEHKGGVERGGTLILLYTHSAFIKQVFNTNRETVGAKVMQARQIISPQGPAMTIADPRRVLSDVLQTTDPLDDFVVLADFCIPNMCCDTDCSDLEVEEPIREEPQPATVGGLISGQRSPTANPRPIADAQVGVVNVQSNQSVNVTRTEANYTFTAQPGTYRITVSAARFATQTRDVTLQSGETRTENFILQLEQIG